MMSAHKRKALDIATTTSAIGDENFVNESSREVKKMFMSSSVSLSSTLSCSEELKESMCEETIRMVNKTSLGVTDDDPGLVVQILNMDDLHTALALPGSPVGQGADPAASSIAFRAWLIVRALAVAPASQCPPNSNSVAFHHLTERDANTIVYSKWQVIPWVASIINHAPPLAMPLVLWIAGTGKGRCDLFVAEQVFK
jgi:hypothetical protein